MKINLVSSYQTQSQNWYGKRTKLETLILFLKHHSMKWLRNLRLLNLNYLMKTN